MKKSALYWILPCIVFSAVHCIREYEIEIPDTDNLSLVIEGSFDNVNTTHTVLIKSTRDYDSRFVRYEPDARVVLKDNEGNEYTFVERFKPGISAYYELKNTTGVAGRSYTLEVELKDGRIFRSKPQLLLDAPPVDSVRVRTDWIESITATGTVIRTPKALIDAYTTAIPDPSGQKHLRWDCELVYIFEEIDDQDFSTPTRQCFITENSGDQLLPLIKLNDYESEKPFLATVGAHRLNHVFFYRACFTVKQYQISQEAYRYWHDVKKLLYAAGNIFDPPPGLLRGNLKQVDLPENAMFGFFEVRGESLGRAYADRQSLGFSAGAYVNNYCFDNSLNGVVEKECTNCLLLKNSTLTKPDWWQ